MNCALEFFPDMALAQAKALDVYYEQHRKPVGPLHGLPISLKDQLRIKVRNSHTRDDHGPSVSQLTNPRDSKHLWAMLPGWESMKRRIPS